MKTRTLVLLGVIDTILYNMALALILKDQEYPVPFTVVTVIVGLG